MQRRLRLHLTGGRGFVFCFSFDGAAMGQSMVNFSIDFPTDLAEPFCTEVAGLMNGFKSQYSDSSTPFPWLLALTPTLARHGCCQLTAACESWYLNAPVKLRL
jgi:hypothetical protein